MIVYRECHHHPSPSCTSHPYHPPSLYPPWTPKHLSIKTHIRKDNNKFFWVLSKNTLKDNEKEEEFTHWGFLSNTHILYCNLWETPNHPTKRTQQYQKTTTKNNFFRLFVPSSTLAGICSHFLPPILSPFPSFIQCALFWEWLDIHTTNQNCCTKEEIPRSDSRNTLSFQFLLSIQSSQKSIHFYSPSPPCPRQSPPSLSRRSFLYILSSANLARSADKKKVHSQTLIAHIVRSD